MKTCLNHALRVVTGVGVGSRRLMRLSSSADGAPIALVSSGYPFHPTDVHRQPAVDQSTEESDECTPTDPEEIHHVREGYDTTPSHIYGKDTLVEMVTHRIERFESLSERDETNDSDSSGHGRGQGNGQGRGGQ